MSNAVPAARIAEVPADARRPLILIDDDDTARRSLQLLLSARGFDVRSFASAEPILADARAVETAPLVIDNRLPEGGGLHLLGTLRQRGWLGPAVLITSSPSPELAAEARAHGFQALMAKPIRARDLLASLGELQGDPIW